ncbi:hypothetical protein CPT_Slocum_044 [Serratia phage Slocum]|nr:hypothetical protein CPT_Slocum_044 [Serratia phage Slocum]URC22488.1 hypothetical protein KAMAJI_00600 [Serratia phage vB_SmaM-Kamaji]
MILETAIGIGLLVVFVLGACIVGLAWIVSGLIQDFKTFRKRRKNVQ